MAAPRQRTAVCILGPHRSGTSLTARVLNLLGVELGPSEALMPADRRTNPTGFWEHQELSYLNDEILAAMSSKPPARQAWRHPPALAAGWEHSGALAPLRHRARDLLRRSFGDAALWGWKDPRTCLTLPFWELLVPQMRFVVCVRNPIDATQSLMDRDGLERKDAMRLWVLYMSAAISGTSGRARVFVFFDDYFKDWRLPAERLARFVGRGESTRNPKVRKALEGHLRAGLRHHRTEPLDALSDPGALPLASPLYGAIELARRARVLDDADGCDDAGSPTAPLNALASALRLKSDQAPA